MDIYQGPDDETIREMSRRMGGGHPLADVRAEEHVAIANTEVAVVEAESTEPAEPVAEPVEEESSDEGLENPEAAETQPEKDQADGNP